MRTPTFLTDASVKRALAVRTQRWWREWRAQNYTWEGLAEQPAPGWWVAEDGELLVALPEDGRTAEEATLQDLWRGEEDNLVSGPDGQYTIFHLPMDWSNGEPTEKKAFSVRRRREFDARLRSVVLAQGGPERSQVSIAGVVFPTKFDVSAMGSPAAAWHFENCWFEKVADFKGYVFSKASSFQSVYFNDTARFSDCRFEKSSEFSDIVCTKTARFSGAYVGEVLFFPSSYFFGSFRLNGATVSGVLEVDGVRCFSDFYLSRTIVQNGFELDGLWVRGSFFAVGLRSEGVFFIQKLEVGQQAVFTGFVCSKDFNLHDSTLGVGRFLRAEFDAYANFTDVHFRDEVSFGGAVFRKYATFGPVIYPSSPNGFNRCFHDACFEGGARFSGKSFVAFSAFDEAVFDRPPLIDLDPAEERDALKRVLRLTRQAALENWREPDDSRRYRSLERAREEQFSSLEGGFRVLKQAMEERRARNLEQILYRWELQANAYRPSTGPFFKAASWIYGRVSNYGSNYIVPMINLAVVYLVFSIFFAIWSSWEREYSGGIWEGTVEYFPDALNFSGRQIFRPFSAWENVGQTAEEWTKAMLIDAGAASRIGVRLLASLESALSLALIFLSGLALKRRFQVS